MTAGRERHRALLGRVADHLLREGLGGASLRPLAAAAGTGDRMLLHHHADREEPLAAIPEEIADRLARMRGEGGGTTGPRPLEALLDEPSGRRRCGPE